MKSLSIVFTDQNEVEVVEELVESPGPGEILCAAEKSLISIGTETLCLSGISDPETNWNDWVKYPFYPGYCMTSKVIEVGNGVKDIHVGDRVATGTSHRQYFNIPQESAYVLPDKIRAEDGSWAALSRVAQLGVRRAQLDLGETVGIVGMGMVGQLVVQYLRASGCRQIICIDPVQSRLDVASKNGATHTLAMDAKRAQNEIKSITGGEMLDVVFDITGHPAAFAPTTQLVRKLGKVILLGDSTTPSQQHLGPRVVSNSISILGIHGSMFPESYSAFNTWTNEKMTSLFFDYILQGRMNVSNLITHHYSPLEAPQVYQRILEDRKPFIGVIFDWDKV